MKSDFIQFSRKKGLTLIELIITMAIFSIIFLLLSIIFNLSLKTLDNLRKDYSQKHEIYTALSYIEDDIRKSNITINTLEEKTFSRDKESIGFMIIRFNNDENSKVRKKYTYIYYSLVSYNKESNNLYRISSSTDRYDINNKFPNKRRACNYMAGNIKNIECEVLDYGIKIRVEMENSEIHERFIAKRSFL